MMGEAVCEEVADIAFLETCEKVLEVGVDHELTVGFNLSGATRDL